MDEERGEIEAFAFLKRDEKAAALFGGEHGVGIRTRKMGEHAGELQVFRVANLSIQRGRLLVPNAEAAHAGVDFQVNRDFAVRSAAREVEAGDFVG